MQREDGSLFRVDFGFVFGATPEIDTPQTVVARAVPGSAYANKDVYRVYMNLYATCTYYINISNRCIEKSMSITPL